MKPEIFAWGEFAGESKVVYSVNMSETANKLRVFRTRSGYTEKQIAAYLGIKNPHVITRWENGETMPDTKNALRMCDLYGVDLTKVYPQLYEKCKREIKARLQQLKKKKGNS